MEGEVTFDPPFFLSFVLYFIANTGYGITFQDFKM